jgi:hypothetical protein
MRSATDASPERLASGRIPHKIVFVLGPSAVGEKETSTTDYTDFTDKDAALFLICAIRVIRGQNAFSQSRPA